MFKRLDEAQRQAQDAPVRVTVNGAELRCRQGDSVAAALFAGGVQACRDTAVNEVPRGPYCMMGVCYDCLVTIDGQANQQGCMTAVREGMKIERQLGARKVQA
ncbi:(2Fe-2S)-binding protein [Achromobacter sp. HZ01]|jgi:NADH dehydrogenase/NADH:ubiquinone oxidoreductase subunit G|uniref:(2Fe-2S)-binding protein n=1 Tax=Achromobacter pulmonis TaxID=1389932 RepID=A0A2N8KI36_9BURK|nr:MULTISPECIES: (2Fe-2S)-binding protein [Achromobacter]MBO9330787.1 (2Fe-2S)-binding protein [Achromobacter xylosoxidans]PND33113.1 (2Fe-2S)-binding protein [Achromobacter pulmonis]RAP63817.1 (2Fe-2S)-binding protein [Achromobacter sp. HZ01]